MDACAVCNIEEARIFLEACSAAGVSIDLLLVETNLYQDSLHLAKRYSLSAISVSSARPVDFILAEVASKLLSSEAAAQSDCNVPDVQGPDEAGLPIIEGPDIVLSNSINGVEVLVVEDNVVNQYAFRHILKGLGISFSLVDNVDDAVARFDDLRPRLVLMDTTLPDPGGFEAAKKIAAIEEANERKTPILGVLSRDDRAVREKCEQAGMRDVIVKPISTEIIERTYRHYVLESFQEEAAGGAIER